MVAILVTCMCIFVFWSINYKPKYFTKLFFYSITQLKYLARMVILYYHPLSFFVLLETLSVLFFFIYFCCSLSNNLKKKFFFFFESRTFTMPMVILPKGKFWCLKDYLADI